MAGPEWPKGMVFSRDGVHVHFKSREEADQWFMAEHRAWESMASGAGSWGAAINANLSLLATAKANQSESVLENLTINYRPSNGTLGRFVSRIPKPIVRAMAFSEIQQPNSIPQQTGEDFFQARALANFYAVVGGNLIGIEQASEKVGLVQKAMDQVEVLRAKAMWSLPSGLVR